MKIIYFFCLLLCSATVFGQTTYTWDQTGSADWTLPSNWVPVRSAPAINDILVFNNSSATTVINVPTQTIGQLLISNATFPNLQAGAASDVLTIAGGTGTDLSVELGSALNINGANALAITLATGATSSITGDMNFSNAAHTLDAADASGITFNSPSIFTQGAGCTGNVFTAAGTPAAILFTAGTIFRQNAGASPFGFAQPSSKIAFQAGSLFRMQQNAAPDFDGRTYANFEVNLGAFNQSPTGANPLTMDTLTIANGTLNINLTGGVNIRGNILVSAGEVLTFNPAAANTLTLNGIVPQSISSAGTLTFGINEAVTINNAAGITLTNSYTVNNLVTFTSGIVTIANPFMLTFSSTASVAGASNASFVNGLISKIGNTAFTFPVGKPNCGPAANVNGYAALAISVFTPGAPTDQFTAEYIRGDALALGGLTAVGLDHVSRCDYWTLTRDNGTSTVDITLSWDDPINNCSSAAPYVNNFPTLTIAHNDNLGATPWDAIAVAGATSGTTVTGTVSWTGVQSTTFGAFSIASTDFNNPLPITLNYFNGVKQNGNHLLNWKVTCTTSPTATMEIQRSTDARNYTGIYSVTATALQCLQPFSYTDNQPVKGVNYYRLKMTDATGKISYSSIVSLLNADKGIDVMTIAPNPIVNRNFKLNVSAAQKVTMEIVIIDMQGRVMQKQTANMIAGFNSIPVNVANFAAGTYQVYGVTAEGRSKVMRFVIQ